MRFVSSLLARTPRNTPDACYTTGKCHRGTWWDLKVRGNFSLSTAGLWLRDAAEGFPIPGNRSPPAHSYIVRNHEDTRDEEKGYAGREKDSVSQRNRHRDEELSRDAAFAKDRRQSDEGCHRRQHDRSESRDACAPYGLIERDPVRPSLIDVVDEDEARVDDDARERDEAED